MKATLTLECNCGNTMTYTVKEELNEGLQEIYVGLTERIYDDNYRAKPTPEGMWVLCGKCYKGVEII